MSHTTNQQSDKIKKSTLLRQFSDELQAQNIVHIIESIIKSVVEINDILTNALHRSLPKVVRRQDDDFIRKGTRSKKHSIVKSNVIQELERQINALSEAIKKADDVIKKFDHLISSYERSANGFSRSIHHECTSSTPSNVVTDRLKPIQIVLPKIVQQTGHICKPAALANLDTYYAERYAVPAIPLRKNHKSRGHRDATLFSKTRAGVSVRELTKQHGSTQGEILEAEKFRAVAKDMGYEVDTLAPDNHASFKKIVIDQLTSGHPLVTCFAVDRETGKPALQYSDNEHACLITGCDPVANTIDIAHWGHTFRAIPIADMFDSMNALPMEREQETYYRREESSTDSQLTSPTYKYAIEPQRKGAGEEITRKSIVPRRGTGFNNTLFSIVPDPHSPRWHQQTSCNDAQP